MMRTLQSENERLAAEVNRLKTSGAGESYPAAGKSSTSIGRLAAAARTAASAPEQAAALAQHSKFAASDGSFELAFHKLPAFFKGLELLIDTASPKLRAAMRHEHCGSADSQAKFTTGNYGVTTTSEVEWWLVVDARGGLKQLRKQLKELGCPPGAYPTETVNIEAGRMRGAAAMLPLQPFLDKMREKNAILRVTGNIIHAVEAGVLNEISHRKS